MRGAEGWGATHSLETVLQVIPIYLPTNVIFSLWEVGILLANFSYKYHFKLKLLVVLLSVLQ